MSRYRELVSRVWDQEVLFSVLLELTYRCNLDCFFCYNDRHLEGRPLSLDQYRGLLADLAALQVLHLTLTGGEPLVHPDFFAIGARARELGFVVRVKTNGHRLTAPTVRRLLDEVDPFLVEVSLHGADAATHDRQTRLTGSFERLVANLETARREGLRIKLKVTLTAWNEHQIPAMFDLIDSWGLAASFSPVVTPRDDGDRSPLAIAASDEGVRNLFRILDRRHPDPPPAEPCTGSPSPSRKVCGAASASLAVDPYGTVYPCVQWRRPLGSLHEKSLRQIWEGSAALAELRSVAETARLQRLAEGPAAEGRAHCLGLSEMRSGNPLAILPDSQNRARLLAEARERPTVPASPELSAGDAC